MSEDVTTLGT